MAAFLLGVFFLQSNINQEQHAIDLQLAAEWVGAEHASEVAVRWEALPLSRFTQQIKEMNGTHLEFPEDAVRTSKIQSVILGGQPPPAYLRRRGSVIAW